MLTASALLAGCSKAESVTQPDSPGARLEAAAEQAGLIRDPASGSLTGSWMLDTDRACILPEQGGTSRVGVLVDYGPGQGCVASGTMKRDGERLDLRLGDACRIVARFDGNRIAFPTTVPAECQSLCRGRATLEAFTVEQVSQSGSEAATLRAPGGRPLCKESS